MPSVHDGGSLAGNEPAKVSSISASVITSPDETGCGGKVSASFIQSLVLRSRSAFAITETELKLIAAPAMIGLSNKPKNG